MNTKLLAIIVLVIFALVSCAPAGTPVQPAVQETAPISQHILVGLDPGHGWENAPGAVGNGIIEKDLNLEVALLTKQVLEENGIEVVMTRDGDRPDQTLRQAAVIMNQAAPVLVVSIHTNSGGVRASGTEACYTDGKSTDDQSIQIAQLLTESLAATLSVPNRGINPESSSTVCGRENGRLYIHDMNPPAALIELGFLSNPTEAELLKSHKEDYARAIAQGILKYLGAQTPSIMAVEPEQSTSVESLPNNVDGANLHFSGQGPTTWPIQKDPGMALVHLKVENCQTVLLSGKGQNIPYDDSGLLQIPGRDDFDDIFQLYTEFQGPPAREENIIIDYPVPWSIEFDAPPHTEMLRIESVLPDCRWEVTILPMTAARSIEPGQVLNGEYDDVLAVRNNLRGLELLFMSPGHERMLQNFGGVTAVSTNGMSFIEWSADDVGLYENFPPDTMYLVISSREYWELEGK